MQKILVSACLLGDAVRYDANALTLSSAILERWLAEGRVVPVCPEVGAGLPTPRAPAEILGGDGRDVLAGAAEVVDRDGGVVTGAFVEGASLALRLCRRHGIRVAVLTEHSPSCGSSHIYDGAFSGTRIPGVGVTTALLRRHGVSVFSQHRLAEADRALLAL